MSAMSDLEKDIEASRARLDEKIDRIQDRLNPGSLVDEMLGSARRAPQLNGVYDGALEAVRRNPVPVLLIAAGVGLLLRGLPGAARRPPAGRRAPLADEPAPVLSTGADRTYDPDQPAGRLARDVTDEPKI